ncbi:MAG: helix-turn-helix transcriptional regulator [Leptolyngbyaceae cyanobacterium CRU_2_3]|nr:helix-turn-helix transcriptional regulator [Leptolyngbyaceae cyanobacterium CRU_2_3]
MNQSSSDYNAILRLQLQVAGIPSFRGLSRVADVSRWQVEQLRTGKAHRIRADALYSLSQALQMSLTDVLTTFSDISVEANATLEPGLATTQLKQEYERLQIEIQQQRQVLYQEFQQDCLRSLESWLIQFPTLIYAAQQNPQFPSKNFVPFIRPLEQLLQMWGIEAIAPIGTEISYDPQLHQLMEGTAQSGDLVKVRYMGYRQGEKLLYRAQVSRVNPN